MMRGYRVILSVLLGALVAGLSGTVRAQSLTLTVYAGAGTGGPIVYATAGSGQSVAANTTALNASLAAAGYGAYSFSNLGGSSNNPGVSGTGGFVLTSGNLTVNANGSPGVGSPITILLQEGGFIFPIGATGASLVTSATANYATAAVGSTQSDHSTFTDSVPVAVTGATINQLANGTPLDPHSGSVSQSLAPFVSPYTLDNVLTLSLSPNGSIGSDGFSGETFATSLPVPEPSTLATAILGLALLAGRPRRRHDPR